MPRSLKPDHQPEGRLASTGIEHFPHVLRNNLVAGRRGMNVIGLVQFRLASDTFQQNGTSAA